jgi:hypothetical protein
MSKTRWDRGRSARTQQWESDYFALAGGLDQQSAALSIKPGRMAQCVNFEEVFGLQGYTFIKGYERFDGRQRPSQVSYAIQPFSGGGEFFVGQTVTDVTGIGVTALVVSCTLQSGTYAGGDAAGYLLLTMLSGGTWAQGDDIKVGGVTRAVASEDTTIGSRGYADHQAALTAAREYIRSLINKPAGSGAILGGAVYNGVVYCVRNVADGTSATLWKSSSIGWTSVRTGLHADGEYVFEVANFSGSTDGMSLFGVSGKGRLFKLDSAGTFTYAAPIFGSEATSTSNVTIGTGAKTFTAAQTARNWTAGDELIVWSTTDATNYMRGTVTAYNSGTGQLDMNITAVGGAGTLASWEIGLTDYTDKPYLLRAHKNHMFLAYQSGQLQSSNVGDPMTYTTSATLFGMGQEIVGLESIKAKTLGIFCTGKIGILEGSSQTDWAQAEYTTKSGAIAGSLQENDGNPIYLNARGVTSLQATQNYGDLEAAIFSRDVKRTLDEKRSLVVGSRMATNNQQYRLYFSDGGCLRFTFVTGASVISPRDVSPTYSEYGSAPTCLFSGSINGEERMFFGTSEGHVMEEDVGTSFDGVAIDYVARLPYNHFKSPALEKQFHKMELELQCDDEVAIYFRQFFDYDDGTYTHGSGEYEIPGIGGQYNVDDFNTFTFNMPNLSRAEGNIDGQARNMGLILWANSDFVSPATLQGVMTYFSKLGVRP